jgi:hypothetical protein
MATLKHRSRKTVTLIVAGGLTLAGTGVAFAYWSAMGDGVGDASTGESVAFDIVGEDSTGPLLAPGGAAQTVPFTVTNPGTASQLLTTVYVYVANDGGTAWTAPSPANSLDLNGCSAEDFTVAIGVAPAYGDVVPGGTRTGTATITMNDLDANQDACQNLVDEVPLYFTTVAQPAQPVQPV